jgi:hypothetical protein
MVEYNDPARREYEKDGKMDFCPDRVGTQKLTCNSCNSLVLVAGPDQPYTFC